MVLFGLFVLLAGAGGTPPPTGEAPAFDVELAGGGRARLADSEGRVMVLHFWASWCRPCLEELPSLEKLQEDLSAKGLDILAVNFAEDSGAVTRFLEKHPVKLKVALDPEGALASLYGVRAVPSTLVIGRDGQIALAYLSQSLGAAELGAIRKVTGQ